MGKSTLTDQEFKLIKKAFCEILGFPEGSLDQPDFLKNKFAEDYKNIKDESKDGLYAPDVIDKLEKLSNAMSSKEECLQAFGDEGTFDGLMDDFYYYAQKDSSYSTRLNEDARKRIYEMHFYCEKLSKYFQENELDELDEDKIDSIKEDVINSFEEDPDHVKIDLLYKKTEYVANVITRYNEHVKANAINEGFEDELKFLKLSFSEIYSDPSDKEAFLDDVFSLITKSGLDYVATKIGDAVERANEIGVDEGLYNDFYAIRTDDDYFKEEHVAPEIPKIHSKEEIEKHVLEREEKKALALKTKADNMSAIIKNFNERVRILAEGTYLKDEQIEPALIKLEGVNAKEGTEEFEKQILDFVTKNKSNEKFFDAYNSAINKAKQYKTKVGADLTKGLERKYYLKRSFHEDLSNKFPIPKLPDRLPKEVVESRKRITEESIKNFGDIESKRNQKENLDQGFNDYVNDYSKKTDGFDQNRYDGKMSLEGMSSVYRVWFPNDKELAPILDAMDELAQMDVTSYSGYKDEGALTTKLVGKLESLIASLEKEERSIHEESIKYLRKPDRAKAGAFAWAEKNPIDNKYYWKHSDGKEELDPKLVPMIAKKDAELFERTSSLDRKNALVSSINNFIRVRRNGELKYDGKEPDLTVKMTDFEGTFVNTDSAKHKLNLSKYPTFYSDCSDKPLFPHEPCADDIRQGSIGDCYFVATLSDIARTHPEKIREAMVDNEDGTVTVRLFTKEHKPFYVKVDKVIPTFFDKQFVAENCLWVTCFEKALAASGIYNGEFHDPVTEDKRAKLKEKYDEYKDLESKGKLSIEDRNQYKQEYPWLFKEIYNSATGQFVDVLVKWPSLNSIAGGWGIDASEIILGDSIRRIKMESFTEYENDNGRCIKSVPTTVEQMCAIVLADSAGGLVSNVFGEDVGLKQGFDLSLPKEELFKVAFKLSKQTDEQKAREEYEKNIIRLSKAIEENGKPIDKMTKEEFVELAREAFIIRRGRSYSHEYSNTMDALAATNGYSKKQIELFDKMDNCLRHSLPVGASIKKNAPIPIAGNHAYSVQKVYIDEFGNRMVRLKNPWGTSKHGGVKLNFKKDGTKFYEKIPLDHGEFEVEFSDFVNSLSQLELSDVDRYLRNNPVEKNVNVEKLIKGNEIDYKTMFAYVGAVDSACKAMLKTEHWYRRSSDEYIKLRNAAKALRHELVGMSGKPIEAFKEKILGMKTAIEEYESYCEKNPVKGINKRREERDAAKNDLKFIMESIEKGYISPLDYKKEYHLTQGIKNEINKLDNGIKTLLDANKPDQLVSYIAAKKYLSDVLDTANNLTTQKIDAMLKPEEIRKNANIYGARVAQVLSGMKADELNSFIKDGVDIKALNAKLKNQFQSKIEAENAEKLLKTNLNKIKDLSNSFIDVLVAKKLDSSIKTLSDCINNPESTALNEQNVAEQLANVYLAGKLIVQKATIKVKTSDKETEFSIISDDFKNEKHPILNEIKQNFLKSDTENGMSIAERLCKDPSSMKKILSEDGLKEFISHMDGRTENLIKNIAEKKHELNMEGEKKEQSNLNK